MSTLLAAPNTGSATDDRRAALRGIAAVSGATLAMATGFGSLVLPSVMAGPLASEFGWSLADIGLGYAFAAFGMATGGVFWGRLSNRGDLRPLLALGSVFVVLPLLALSQVSALWQFHAAHAVLGFLGFGCLYPAVVCGVAAWFPHRRGLVMGVVTAGGAAGQGLMPYAAELLTAVHGWRQGYEAIALCVALAQVAVVAGVRRPAALKDDAPGPVAERRLGLSRRPRLLVLSAAAFCCCACMGVPLIHLAGHVSAICGSSSAGATAMLAAMAAGAVGRIGFGHGADRIGNLPAYLAASGLQTLCVALLPLAQSGASTVVLSVLFGLGFAGNMTCLLLCIRDEAPEKLYGSAVGVVMFIAWLGMGFGGYVGGAAVDLSGSYTVSFLIAATVGVANLALLLALVRPSPGRGGGVRVR